MSRIIRFEKAAVSRIRIPFLLQFTHAMASREHSDSFILHLSGPDGEAYGEGIVREYVSGALGAGTDPLDAAACSAARILGPLAGRPVSWDAVSDYLLSLSLPPQDLPILCAVETALISLFSRASGKDIYRLLDREPLRREVIYGAVLPMLPERETDRLLETVGELELPYLRVKIGRQDDVTERTLTRVRKTVGKDFDIRVDVNAVWTLDDALRQMPLLRKHGVSMIEEPFGRESPLAAELASRPEARGIGFIADESVLTLEDVRRIAREGIFSMLNLRLSKNGGLLRVLALAEEAARSGLRYQIGCHVGETGILSAVGRAAAGMLPDPVYADGSYDRFLLSENITTEDLTFGRGGKAPILRGNGIGAVVDPERLRMLQESVRDCW